MDDKNTIVGKSAAHEKQVQKIGSVRELAQSVVDLTEVAENHEFRLTELEDTMRVNGVQEQNLTKGVNQTVVALLDGKKSKAYEDRSLRSRAYSEINKEIKDKFGIPRRSELPRKDYQAAMNFIDHWIPSNDLKIDIIYLNRQLVLD